jgi:hypothetical protein
MPNKAGTVFLSLFVIGLLLLVAVMVVGVILLFRNL